MQATHLTSVLFRSVLALGIWLKLQSPSRLHSIRNNPVGCCMWFPPLFVSWFQLTNCSVVFWDSIRKRGSAFGKERRISWEHACSVLRNHNILGALWIGSCLPESCGIRGADAIGIGRYHSHQLLINSDNLPCLMTWRSFMLPLPNGAH